MDTQDQQFGGTIHVGTSEDLNELGALYKSTYPHTNTAAQARDIKPEEANSWVTYRSEDGEILIAMQIRFCG